MKLLRLFLATAPALLLPLCPLNAKQAAPAASTVSPGKVHCPATTPAKPKSQFAYLTGKEEAFRTFPPAPERNSQADHLDLLITLTVQNSRTPEQITEAKADQNYGQAILALNHIVNSTFETDYPETSAVGRLIQRVNHDGGLILNQLKQKNARPRPFVQHPGLVLPLFLVSNYSYPSGHSAGSALQAELLAELFPAHAAELRAKAQLIAASRVIAGVHYESDIEAGQALGQLIFKTLKNTPAFRRDLAAAKAELAAPAIK